MREERTGRASHGQSLGSLWAALTNRPSCPRVTGTEGSLWKVLSLPSTALKVKSSGSDFYLCQSRGPERTETFPKIARGPTRDRGLDPPAHSCSTIPAAQFSLPWTERGHGVL